MFEIGAGMTGSKLNAGNSFSFDDATFSTVLCDLHDTAQVLEIPDEAFAGKDEATGTDSLITLMEDMKGIQEVSNEYKVYMYSDVVPVLRQVESNINDVTKVVNNSMQFIVNGEYVPYVNEAVDITKNVIKNTPKLLGSIKWPSFSELGYDRLLARMGLSAIIELMTLKFNVASAPVTWVLDGMPAINEGYLAELVKRKSFMYQEFKLLCRERNPETGEFSEDNLAMRRFLNTVDFKSREDGSYYVDVNTYKLDDGAEKFIEILSFMTGRDCSSFEDVIEKYAEKLGIDKEVCWQQYGGYCDFYDMVFDVATDMRRDMFVVNADIDGDGTEEAYTFWFWKGDYCNLGYGGEIGFYEKDGEKSNFVHCGVHNELQMSLNIDYDGDGEYDYNTLNNHEPGETTWWETSFNPYAEDFLNEKGKKFDAGDMVIQYTVDLSGEENEALYEAVKEKLQEEQLEGYELSPRTKKLIITFEGDGKDIWSE